MSTALKYANLPDLDPAPDVYETPDLIDDSSTQQTSTARRSDSVTSEDDGGAIDRHRLDPDAARTHFLPPQRNRYPGLSDRIKAKRSQYRESTRTRQEDSLEANELSVSSDEDEESLERKVARLRQEVAEVKEEFERRRAGGENGDKTVSVNEQDTLDALGRILDGGDAINTNGAASRIVKKLSVPSRVNDTSKDISTTESHEQSQNGTAYTVTYAPSYQHNHVLSKVADFNARITFIETVLGIDTIPLPIQERLPTRAIFPMLDNLDRQISTLSSSTETSLDLINRRVRQLTQDAQKLGEARAAAKAAQEALIPDEDEPERPLPTIDGEIQDPEQISKINALYGTLTTIESLAPLLPSVLDRLRSLQSVHADAASASQSLAQLETRQENMTQELKGWREGLETVESAMKEGERTMAENASVVEKLVKELEDRMKNLGST